MLRQTLSIVSLRKLTREMNNKKLYDKAKEAYYNGEPLMSDQEFDKLESDIGLENSGYIGTHHSSGYTVKHPFIMGSLSKVQVKEDRDHNVNWDELQEQVNSYLRKSHNYGDPLWSFEVTPKYDGCSFEAVISLPDCNLQAVSTRGDGEWGKDIKPWFLGEFVKHFNKRVVEWFDHEDPSDADYEVALVVRGECLIKKTVFEEKYTSFANPRSFVAGVLGQDWVGTLEQMDIRNDLSFVCYDYRVICDNGVVVELDYLNRDQDWLPGIMAKPGVTNLKHGTKLEDIYKTFDNVRETCPFALDGFVIKPAPHFRLQDMKRERQEDCVAVKFKPTIVETTIEGVEWNVGKSGEYYPVAHLAPVKMDGKVVSRVSLHNYGYIIEHKITEGAKVQVSLAGDIIPFLYSVIELPNDALEKIDASLPADAEVQDEIHLMKKSSEDDARREKFLASARALKVKGIGPSVAKMLYETCGKPEYIMDLMDDNGLKAVESNLERSKTRDNILEALKDYRDIMSVGDAVRGMCLPSCGEKTSAIVAEMLCGREPDTKGISEEVAKLAYDAMKNHLEIGEQTWQFIKDKISKSDDVADEEIEKIKAILTGSPAGSGWKTKSEWLNAHPQFIETTKWADAQVLFTDSLESTSSKMMKAQKCGLKILTYND